MGAPHPSTAMAQKPTSSHQGYLDCIQRSLEAALCLQNFGSQRVERHNKPMVESQSDHELLCNPVLIARDRKEISTGDQVRVMQEKVLIEASVNSVRISVGIKQADDLEEFLVHKFMSFLTQRAEHFFVLRRKPVPGFDISFLITNFHCETMYRHKLVAFVVSFLESIDSEVAEMKIQISARARTVAKTFLQTFT